MLCTRRDFLRDSAAALCALASPAELLASSWRNALELPATTANYWCTWWTQHKGGDPARGFRQGRDAMCEENLFGKGGWADAFFPESRRDLYLVLDDGWDVPFGAHHKKDRLLFGSHEIDTKRFPSFKGTPAERLRQLNEAVKARGWRGAGLWVACQGVGEKGNRLLEGDALADYWKRKLEWSQTAGIEYWKVDWGVRQKSAEFRAFLYDLKERYAPSVNLEHAECQGVVTRTSAELKSESFRMEPDSHWYKPGWGKVGLDVRLDAGAPLGAFGWFDELACMCGKDCRIWVQDLAGGPVHDVTGLVRFEGGCVHVPGDLLAKIGKESDKDRSHPATLVFAGRSPVL